MSFGSRSLPKPTPEESARIAAAKEGPCIPCLVWSEEGNMPEDWIIHGCDYQHVKSGNVRVGHAAGYACCLWHHRQHPIAPYNHAETRRLYGPSLMDGSALFKRTYGQESFLIAKQTKVIEGNG